MKIMTVTWALTPNEQKKYESPQPKTNQYKAVAKYRP